MDPPSSREPRHDSLTCIRHCPASLDASLRWYPFASGERKHRDEGPRRMDRVTLYVRETERSVRVFAWISPRIARRAGYTPCTFQGYSGGP